MLRSIQLVEAFSTIVIAVRGRKSIRGTYSNVDRDDINIDKERILLINKY